VSTRNCPPSSTVDAALGPGRPPGAASGHPAPGDPLADTNIVLRCTTSAGGDVDAAAAQADLVVEHTYEYPMVTHFAIEPHACLAAPDGDGIVVWTSIQHLFQFQRSWQGAGHLFPGAGLRPRLWGGFLWCGKSLVFFFEFFCFLFFYFFFFCFFFPSRFFIFFFFFVFFFFSFYLFFFYFFFLFLTADARQDSACRTCNARGAMRAVPGVVADDTRDEETRWVLCASWDGCAPLSFIYLTYRQERRRWRRRKPYEAARLSGKYAWRLRPHPGYVLVRALFNDPQRYYWLPKYPDTLPQLLETASADACALHVAGESRSGGRRQPRLPGGWRPTVGVGWT